MSGRWWLRFDLVGCQADRNTGLIRMACQVDGGNCSNGIVYWTEFQMGA